jgi:large subunit ribosomal protein L27
MAHTKSAGAAKYGRDSQPKYLGVKKSDGERVKNGDIVVRQRGTNFVAGAGIRRGGDDTLYAVSEGLVRFATRQKIRFDGSRRSIKIVNVVSQAAGA